MEPIAGPLTLPTPPARPARIAKCALVAALAILSLGRSGSPASLSVPGSAEAGLERPYSVVLHLCFQSDLELTPAMHRLSMVYAVEMLSREWGEAVSVRGDEATSRHMDPIIQAKGLQALLPEDLAGAALGADRCLLVHVRTRWNSWRVTMREWNPGDVHLSPVEERLVSGWRPLGRAIVEWALAAFSFEGYLTTSSYRSEGVTVRLKAAKLLDTNKKALNNDGRDRYFRVVRNTLDRLGRVIERQALELEVLESEFDPKRGWIFRWVGVPSRQVARQKLTSYRIYRLHLKRNRTRVLRLVSTQNRKKPLPGYTVRQSQTTFDDIARAGLQADVDGRVTIEAPDPKPVLVSVRRRTMTLRKFVLAVQDGAPPLTVAVDEVDPEYHECDAERRKIHDDIQAQSRLATAVRDEVNAHRTNQEHDEALKCVERLDRIWPTEAMFAARITALEERCQAQGGILKEHLPQLREELRNVVAAKPDCDEMREQIRADQERRERVERVTAGVGEATRLENEAAQLEDRLDYEGAIRKLEEAVKASPEQAERLRQRIAAIRPQSQAHDSARRFVLDRLRNLTFQQAGEAAGEIRTHLRELSRASDVRFFTEGCNLTKGLAQQAFDASEKLLQKADATEKEIEDAARHYKTFKALDAIRKEFEQQKK